MAWGIVRMHIPFCNGYRTDADLRAVIIMRRGSVPCKRPSLLKRAGLLVLRRMITLDELSLPIVLSLIRCQLLLSLCGEFVILIVDGSC